MYTTQAFARKSKDDKTFYKIDIKRNDVGDDDVEIDLKYCGICHSDVHIADSAFFSTTNYPIVPGHELAGVVTRVGKNVKDIKKGDKAGVGCISDSCLTCPSCKKGEEQTCHNGFTGTYNGKVKHGHIATDSGFTHGGYSDRITVHRNFAVKIPAAYPLEKAGPIFCAGITMYSPLKHWGASKGGMNVGVVGIGGLGQMGVRLAKALGNEVTAISTSPNKKDVALSIGATNFVVSTDPESMKAASRSLDLILNTVSVNHECAHYIKLLRQDGTLVQIGAAVNEHKISQIPLMYSRLSISGSVIGGLKDTQEVIDFCQEKAIYPETELITWDQLSGIYEKLDGKNDSIKRYVLDIEKSLKK